MVILGDMGEQGEKSDIYHYKIKEKLKKLDFHQAILCGEKFWKTKKDLDSKIKFFKTKKNLEQFLINKNYIDTFFLLKACRLLEFDKLLNFFN